MTPLRSVAECGDAAPVEKVDIQALEVNTPISNHRHRHPSNSINLTSDQKQMSSETDASTSTEPTIDPNALQPGRYDSIDFSLTFPALPKPPSLDGSHAGDFGFDPLGFTSNFDMYYLQECETRHARLAMLAVVGWPMAELIGFAKGGVAPR